MSGQMCWLPNSNLEGQPMLHLREHSFDAWLPYTASHLKVPDILIPIGSKGWSTYQKLRQAGWTLIPTAEARNTLIRSEASQDQKKLISMSLIFVSH